MHSGPLPVRIPVSHMPSQPSLEMEAAVLFGESRPVPRLNETVFGFQDKGGISSAARVERRSLRSILQSRREAIGKPKRQGAQSGLDEENDDDFVEDVDLAVSDVVGPVASRCTKSTRTLGEDAIEAWSRGVAAPIASKAGTSPTSEVSRVVAPHEDPNSASKRRSRSDEEETREAHDNNLLRSTRQTTAVVAASSAKALRGSVEATLVDLDRRFLVMAPSARASLRQIQGGGDDHRLLQDPDLKTRARKLESMLNDAAPAGADLSAELHEGPRGRRSDRLPLHTNATAYRVQERLNREFEYWAGISQLGPEGPGSQTTSYEVDRIVRAAEMGHDEEQTTRGQRRNDVLHGVVQSLDVAHEIVALVLQVDHVDPTLREESLRAAGCEIQMGSFVVAVMELGVYRHTHALLGSRVALGPCVCIPPLPSSKGMPVVMATYCVRDITTELAAVRLDTAQTSPPPLMRLIDPLAHQDPKGRKVGGEEPRLSRGDEIDLLDAPRGRSAEVGCVAQAAPLGLGALMEMPEASRREWYVPSDLVTSMVAAFTEWSQHCHPSAVGTDANGSQFIATAGLMTLSQGQDESPGEVLSDNDDDDGSM